MTVANTTVKTPIINKLYFSKSNLKKQIRWRSRWTPLSGNNLHTVVAFFYAQKNDVVPLVQHPLI